MENPTLDGKAKGKKRKPESSYRPSSSKRQKGGPDTILFHVPVQPQPETGFSGFTTFTSTPQIPDPNCPFRNMSQNDIIDMYRIVTSDNMSNQSLFTYKPRPINGTATSVQNLHVSSNAPIQTTPERPERPGASSPTSTLVPSTRPHASTSSTLAMTPSVQLPSSSPTSDEHPTASTPEPASPDTRSLEVRYGALEDLYKNLCEVFAQNVIESRAKDDTISRLKQENVELERWLTMALESQVKVAMPAPDPSSGVVAASDIGNAK
ncbi:hypothetical protein BDZ97DRAFT_1756895 [Flammula alnicola]|nr:hypothetical protein BDZ97DRAFT_1756895 [Flammula alnicola]